MARGKLDILAYETERRTTDRGRDLAWPELGLAGHLLRLCPLGLSQGPWPRSDRHCKAAPGQQQF